MACRIAKFSGCAKMRNLRLVVAYDGTEFHGWQRQPNARTIQGTLEDALEELLGEKVRVWGSGRTDAGVHAAGQVANFRTGSRIPCENLLKALNSRVPPEVRVKAVDEVEVAFHARYQARAKVYRYRMLLAPIVSPFIGRYVYHYPHPLDRAKMAAAARLLEGEHDFTSFAGAAGPMELSERRGAGEPDEEVSGQGSPSAVRKIFSSRLLWRARSEMLIYEVRGTGFLHHMVRNIAGTLLEVGRGKLEPASIAGILEARDRTRAGPTAPAQGLCLMRVEYG